MSVFKVGDRVVHPEHGVGTVGWMGKERIGVEFDLFGKMLLLIEDTTLRLTTSEDDLNDLSRTEATTGPDVSVEPFLVFENGEVKHFMGSHWGPFFDDAHSVLERLPEILPVAQLHRGYSQFYPPPDRDEETKKTAVLLIASSETLAVCMRFENRPHPWDELTPWRSPGGALAETRERALEWSGRNTGIAVVAEVSESTKKLELRTLFPYCFAGIERMIVLKRLRIWESGVEAQMEGTLGDARIAFFDMDFVNNRDWYRPGGTYQFILVGIAYDAKLVEEKTLTIHRAPEYFEGIKWLTGQNLESDPGVLEETIHTEGFAMLIPVVEWDRDDYAFRGPVKDVWGMSMLGQRAWRVRVTVMRFPDANIENREVELDVIVTERAWQGEAPPQVGQEIEGRLWLQGRLWLVPSP